MIVVKRQENSIVGHNLGGDYGISIMSTELPSSQHLLSYRFQMRRGSPIYRLICGIEYINLAILHVYLVFEHPSIII